MEATAADSEGHPPVVASRHRARPREALKSARFVGPRPLCVSAVMARFAGCSGVAPRSRSKGVWLDKSAPRSAPRSRRGLGDRRGPQGAATGRCATQALWPNLVLYGTVHAELGEHLDLHSTERACNDVRGVGVSRRRTMLSGLYTIWYMNVRNIIAAGQIRVLRMFKKSIFGPASAH